jgi:hypothetical protein
MRGWYREDWPKIIEFMVEHMIKLETTMKGVLADLLKKTIK